MKHVLLSADSAPAVYSVPDVVADHLDDYCMEFCTTWLRQSPHAQKYRLENGVVCYNEKDFIEYLNTWLFPNEQSVLIEILDGVSTKREIPNKYRECIWFNF